MPAPLSSPAVAVVTSGVRKGPANQRVESVATLLADESVVIRSEIDGRIGALDIQEGQPIEKDRVLVTLDPAEYRAELDQREAGLA
ncbi:MAG: biotin/lipoyl-binding protein, partial [Gammaproteobacteria bacterium]